MSEPDNFGFPEDFDFSRITIVVSCCFCFEPIETEHVYGVTLSHTTDDGEYEQTWWAHLDCFKDRLHPKAQVTVREEFE